MANAQPPPQVDLERIVRASAIPDTIKCIPVFKGETFLELNPWLETVESTLALYGNLQDNAIYPIWMRHIRTKIQGPANEALVNSHTPLIWASIRQSLIDHFGDRRDLSTLTQKIPYLKQANKTIKDFYQECHSLHSSINSHISLDPFNNGH
jgi:hypothetical protein